MKLKKLYKYSRKRQIWRIIPAGEEVLVIEERDNRTREVFFNCIDIRRGKSILKDMQLEEKFWVGIEESDGEVLILHKYIKPDLPQHKGIIVYDIRGKKILWENGDFTFLFREENKIYGYKQLFDERKYAEFNLHTGEIISNPDGESILQKRNSSGEKELTDRYHFPEIYRKGAEETSDRIISREKENSLIVGNINSAKYGDLLLINYHEKRENDELLNIFKAFDIQSEKAILKETLNRNLTVFIPDCFFIKDDLLFLLKEKNEIITLIIK
jgi:hypothetical protein